MGMMGMNPMMMGMYGMNPMMMHHMNPMMGMMGMHHPMMHGMHYMNPMMNPMMGMMPGMGSMGMMHGMGGLPPSMMSVNGKPTHIHHHFGDEGGNHHFKGRHHPKINIYTNPKRVPSSPPTTETDCF